MAGYRVVGTDINPFAAGLYRSDKGYVVSKDWDQYIIELQRICEKEKVDVLIPGSDPELLILSENRELFERIGLCMLMGTHESIMIARDKFKTQEFLRANNFPHIRSYLPEDLHKCVEEVGFPFVIKPRSGYGEKHFYLVANPQEASALISYMRRDGWEPLLQEYIETDAEYTTGVRVSKNGEVLGSVCAWRKLKKGLSANVLVDDFTEVRRFMERVAAAMNTRGPLNFQAKLRNGKCFIFEINARFSGTTSIRAMAGVNDVDLLIRNFLHDEKVRVEPRKLVATLYSEYLFLNTNNYSDVLSTREVTRSGTISASSW
jgi:carbamoyl-phosphate synthase large subunit